MDFKASKKTKLTPNLNAGVNQHDLQLYQDRPDTLLTVGEFEEYAIERLKILRILENVSSKSLKEDSKKYVEEELNKQGLKMYKKLFTSSGESTNDDKGTSNMEARQRDHTSHFILKICYCQNEEQRRWFAAREVELFKFRWSYLSSEGKKRFLDLNKLKFPTLDTMALKNITGIKKEWLCVSPQNDYYCVSCFDVLDLVRHRRVVVHGGKAFVTSADLISILSARFRANLSQSLVIMSRNLPKIQEDERLKRLMKIVPNAYLGKNYVSTGNKSISIHSMEMFSKTSFPLCMKQMYSALKRDHHLKHMARQQFGLFLKGIGLSMEDALEFWRVEFTKKPEVDLDSFNKKYAYGIRYNYGKEGKRTNYTPYSCSKIITNNPGPGDCHGCPFKHNDVKKLQMQIKSNVPQISNADMDEITKNVESHQYQFACSKYFEVVHRIPLSSCVNHPNQYFEESQRLTHPMNSNVS